MWAIRRPSKAGSRRGTDELLFVDLDVQHLVAGQTTQESRNARRKHLGSTV